MPGVAPLAGLEGTGTDLLPPVVGLALFSFVLLNPVI